MNFELTEEHKAVQRVAKEFAEREIAPRVVEDERAGRFQVDIIRKMAELGFFGALFPEEYGGTNMGVLAHVLIAEQITKVEAALGTLFNMQAATVPFTIYRNGTEEQKRRYIRDLITCKAFGCFAITEPNAGSDISAIQTKAVPDGEHFILNGTKTWITNASVMDVGIVFARTGPERHRGLSAFIVERRFPGIRTTTFEHKIGVNCSPTGEIIFEDCRVPRENLLGELGGAMQIAESALAYGRITVAARALGVAQGCLDEILRYANEREQFGQKIGYFQLIKHLIADLIPRVEGARLLVYRAAWLADQGEPFGYEASVAKLWASETAVKAAEYGMRVFGAYGATDEYPVNRYFREAILHVIGEGGNNIQEILIANHALGWRRIVG